MTPAAGAGGATRRDSASIETCVLLGVGFSCPFIFICVFESFSSSAKPSEGSLVDDLTIKKKNKGERDNQKLMILLGRVARGSHENFLHGDLKLKLY